MKVFITGSDGLLGSNLVRKMLADQHEVSVFIHPSSHAKTIKGLQVKKFYGDILNKDSIAVAMDKSDVVIHAAALTDVWPARSDRVRKVNITGTQNMIEVALSSAIKKFIYIGSASSVCKPCGEQLSNTYPGKKFNLDYIDSKHAALQLVLHAANEENLPAVAILPTFMIGPYDSLPTSGKMILAYLKGELRYCSKGGRNFVHVNDVVAAVNNAITQGEIGKYYVAGNANLSYRNFFNLVADITGKNNELVTMPDGIIKTAGWLSSKWTKMLKQTPRLSYEMSRIACEEQFIAAHEAREALNIPDTPIEDAIRDCLQWFQQEGYLQSVQSNQ